MIAVPDPKRRRTGPNRPREKDQQTDHLGKEIPVENLVPVSPEIDKDKRSIASIRFGSELTFRCRTCNT